MKTLLTLFRRWIDQGGAMRFAMLCVFVANFAFLAVLVDKLIGGGK